MPDESMTSDLPPQPPEPPLEGECCQRGCEFCVWVFYHEAQRNYESAYAQWRERRGRQPETLAGGEP